MADTKSQIVNLVAKLGRATTSDINSHLPNKLSRQWISTLLNQLISEGRISRAQEGKQAIFVVSGKENLIDKKVKKHLQNKHLQEDKIFEDLKSTTPFLQNLKENSTSILYYAFTEMLNNAIEHSQSKSINISFEEADDNLIFEIKDTGIGVFNNIKTKKKLSSELEAIGELLKGKTTTLPHSHSGEGIFFTSKIADCFILDSFGFRLRIDNTIPDIFIENIKSTKGTKVRFEIKKRTRKHLSDIFLEYQAEPGSHAFDKTKVHVKLYKAGTIYISRSQARRLMNNLEKYKVVVLDFADITTIGQAFADEVFRVFTTRHPETKIEAINMSEPVKFMVDRTNLL